MLEVKANALEESFDAILQADRIAGIEERIDALDTAMRVQAERSGRPPLDGAKGSDLDPARAAFTENYLRRGIEAGVELKSFSGASAGAGGYAVPREIDHMIEAALKAISPIRAVANVVRTGTAGYRKLVTTGGVVSGWASETGSRSETATPTFQEIAPPSGELYANPAASQAMLDDAQFDVESWLADEIARELGSVSRTGQGYSVTLRGLGDLLGQAAAPATSPTCRARLGDAACGVDLRGLREIAVLDAIEDERVRFAGLGEGVYPFGNLRWLTGPCAGISQMVVDQDGDDLFLAELPPLPVAPGMRAALTQGCDKRLATCSARFGNAVNFRGEPFLPGMDLLTRYPGA